MRKCAAIRTDEINDRVINIAQNLEKHFRKSDIYIVLDKTKKKSVTLTDYKVVDVTSSKLEELNLPELEDWGWRCGDYFLYVLSSVVQYDYYWLIEPDVGFHEVGFSILLNATDEDNSDFLAVGHGSRDEGWYWSKYLTQNSKFGCLFPLTRTSKRAIDFLYHERVELADLLGLCNISNWPNDEGFVSTNLEVANFICKDLRFINGLNFNNFSSFIPILMSIQTEFDVFHPWLSWGEFYNKFPQKAINVYKKGGDLDFLKKSLKNLTKDQVVDVFHVALLEAINRK